MVTFPTQLKFPRRMQELARESLCEPGFLLWIKPLDLSAAGKQSSVENPLCGARREGGHPNPVCPVEIQPGGARRAGNSRQPPGPAGGMLCPGDSHLEGLEHIPAFLPGSLLSLCRSKKLRPLPAWIWGIVEPTLRTLEGFTPTPQNLPALKMPPHPCCSSPGEVFGDKTCQKATRSSPIPAPGDTGAAFWCHISGWGRVGPGLYPHHGPARGQRCSPNQA